MSDRLRVRRRLVAWRPRLRRLRDAPDGVDTGDDGPGGGGGSWFDIDLHDVLLGLAVIVAGVLLVTVVVPAVVLAVELVALLLVTLVVVLVRLVRRDAWPVEARAADGRVVHTWWVHGWRAAGRAADSLQRRADAGEELPPDGLWWPDG